MKFRSSSRHVAVAGCVALLLLVTGTPCWARDQDRDQDQDKDHGDVEDIFQVETRSGRQQHCGQSLVQTLQMLCEGRYNGVPRSKPKKNYGSPDNEFVRPQEGDSDYGQMDVLQALQGFRGQLGTADWLPRQSRFPFRERLAASAFLSGRLRRQTHGVHDECCLKSCTIDELRAYCSS